MVENTTSVVRKAYTIQSDELLRLTVAPVRDRSNRRDILVTGEHRIWTDHSGWLAARDLEPGNWLHGIEHEMIEVIAIERLEGTHQVYTFQLQGDSAFYAAGILVEDLCGGLFLPDPELLTEINQ